MRRFRCHFDTFVMMKINLRLCEDRKLPENLLSLIARKPAEIEIKTVFIFYRIFLLLEMKESLIARKVH